MALKRFRLIVFGRVMVNVSLEYLFKNSTIKIIKTSIFIDKNIKEQYITRNLLFFFYPPKGAGATRRSALGVARTASSSRSATPRFNPAVAQPLRGGAAHSLFL
ncbi:hypothetical protein [Minwuia thermotolerans]|uniref:hypothetical protein n=1 Tax=Minwuia thermotolerans TaxID=2056226 RepID=UPI000F6379FD|nr:hypothetical protein [Minwuia thermotolerans]